jgi:hypothetical protein
MENFGVGTWKRKSLARLREREREREGVQYCSAEESRAELKRDNVSH